MTLREALISFNLRIGHPECLANLEIMNYADLCRFSLLKYFQSQKFRDDMDDCILAVQEANEHGYDIEDLVLLIVKSHSEDGLTLKVDISESYMDSIDTYQ